jgi:alkanesulfonate monooxygenase SsuD/methylene tetrahydromethanopterin reductase-like flavin-dependent oxidoreductase (luciferase family)
MRFGLLCSAQAGSEDLPPETGQGFQDYLDLNVEAERLGFHSSFLVEHHFTGWNQVSATLMLLTALAMRTTTMRLGSAVMVLPWHDPVLLAEQAATLDLISGGRLDLGIGKGYRHSEFNGFQVPREEAEVRFDEALDLLRRSWTERSRFSHRGRFWRFEEIVVEPPPSQLPYPPLWIAAASPTSINRAAARGLNLMLDQYASSGQMGERIALYRSGCEARGRPFDPSGVVVARQLYVASDRADAEAALARLAESTRRTVDVSRSMSVPIARVVSTAAEEAYPVCSCRRLTSRLSSFTKARTSWPSASTSTCRASATARTTPSRTFARHSSSISRTLPRTRSPRSKDPRSVG